MNRTIIARLSPAIVDLIISLKSESQMDFEEVVGTLWLLADSPSKNLKAHPRYKELVEDKTVKENQ